MWIFWLALTFEVPSHHRSAKSWFDSIEEEIIAFCRLTQLGFLRLATNPPVFAEEALKLPDAWGCFDRFLEDATALITATG